MSGQFLAAVTPWFASLLVLGLVAAGLTMLVAPAKGPELLKILGVAVALFIAGSMLSQAFRAGHVEIGNLAGALCRLAGLGAALTLIGCAFLYPFNQKAALEWLKRAGLLLAALLVLPELAAGLARAMGPAMLGVSVLTVSVAAYCLREHRKPHRQVPRRTHRPERTPGLPRGGTRV